MLTCKGTWGLLSSSIDKTPYSYHVIIHAEIRLRNIHPAYYMVGWMGHALVSGDGPFPRWMVGLNPLTSDWECGHAHLQWVMRIIIIINSFNQTKNCISSPIPTPQLYASNQKNVSPSPRSHELQIIFICAQHIMQGTASGLVLVTGSCGAANPFPRWTVGLNPLTSWAGSIPICFYHLCF